MTFSLGRIILLSLFLFWSLHSLYSYTFGLPLVATLSGLLMFAIYFTSKLKNPIIYVNELQLTIIYFYFLLLLWSFIDLLFVQDTPDFKRIVFLFLSVIFIFGIRYIVNELIFRHILIFYLVIHGGFLFLQFFTFYLFNYHIDYLVPFTGVPQSVFGGSFTTGFTAGFMRASGLYNEPGTYSNFIAPILMLFSRYYNFGKAYKRIFWFSFISIIITLSTAGVIFSLIILLFLPNINKKLKLFVVGLISLFTAPYFYWRFVKIVKGGWDSGGGIREEFILNIYTYVSSNLHGFFFGSSNMMSKVLYIDYVMPDNDAGLIVYLVHTNGPIFTIFLLLFLILRCRPIDRYSAGAFIILLLGKIPLFSPFAPVLFYIIFYRDQMKKQNSL